MMRGPGRWSVLEPVAERFARRDCRGGDEGAMNRAPTNDTPGTAALRLDKPR